MTTETLKRAAKALLYHNRSKKPNEMGLGFRAAYVVGQHVWLQEHCAKEWVNQVETPHQVEVLSYNEAYAFARTDKQLKLLIH